MKNSEYWQNRALQRLTISEKMSESHIKAIENMYSKAFKDIKEEIDNIYSNYSKATGLDVQELKTLLTKSQTKKTWNELKKQGLDQYVMNNYKSRISKLEQLQAQIYAKAKKIYPQELLENEMCYKGVINDSWYRAFYDTQIGTGLDFTFSKLDDRMVNKLLNMKWQGSNFSERIWNNTDILANSLTELLGSALLSGQSIEKTTREIAKRFDVSKSYARRLVRTETNYLHNEVDAMAYEDIGIEEYILIAVLDNRTSAICQDLDHKHFKFKDRKVGENYPPFHPNCRTTTGAYFGEEEEKELQRRARNPITGKNETIDNMSYNEWIDKNNIQYGKENIDKSFKMVKNKVSDKAQYEKYVKVLGKDCMPDSLEKWQELKYNNEDEYKLTKYNYKLRNEVIHNPQNVINSIEISTDKYTKYLFGGKNEQGLIKGKLIDDVLGYNKDNYMEFDKLIKDNINLYPKRFKNSNQYGEIYEVNMVVKGLKDRQAKVTVGVISKDNNNKLTSIYINKVKESELRYENY